MSKNPEEQQSILSETPTEPKSLTTSIASNNAPKTEPAQRRTLRSIWENLRRKRYPPERTIHVGKGTQELNRFPDNYIKTSKYSIFNFVFKYLLEQFMRIANFYFLVISALQVDIYEPFFFEF